MMSGTTAKSGALSWKLKNCCDSSSGTARCWLSMHGSSQTETGLQLLRVHRRHICRALPYHLPLISWWIPPERQRCSPFYPSTPAALTPAEHARSWTTEPTAWVLMLLHRRWWHWDSELLPLLTDLQTGRRFYTVPTAEKKTHGFNGNFDKIGLTYPLCSFIFIL